MPFQRGNKHGRTNKLFDGALRRAIAQDDGQRLREAAEQLLTQAAAGEPWALNMLADRLDGKADQTVHVNKSAQEMSLADIAAEIAELRGGGDPATGGAAVADAVH